MKKILLLLLTSSYLLVPQVRAQLGEFNKAKIAVLDFSIQGQGLDPDMGKIVAEWLITSFVKDGRFEVIERRLLESIINEQKLVMTGVVDSSSAEELGRLLGVKVIITGSLMKYHDMMEANARIIDVKDASIIAAECVQSSSAIELEDLVKKMAAKIISDFPLEGYVVSHNETTVTLDLGQQSGVKPGMKFSVYKEGNVIKHPRTGEVLDIERIQTALVEITAVRQNISRARIIENTEGMAVEYGQHVSNIPALAEHFPFPANEERAPRPVKPAPPSAAKPVPAIIAGDPLYARIMSENSSTKVRAIKEVAEKRSVDETTLDVLESELIKGYQIKKTDRYHVDAMSWCCTILGLSGNEKYRETLNEVSANAINAKLRAYALKGIALLDRRRR